MATLHTANGLALRELMTEVLFPFGEPEEKEPPQPKAQVAEIRYKGASSRGILYLLNDGSNEFFSPAANDAFLKTIRALGLGPDQFTLVNLAHNETIPFSKLQDRFMPEKVVFSGVRPDMLGLMSVALHEPWSADTLSLMTTYTFEELLNDSEKKKQFWTALKKFLS